MIKLGTRATDSLTGFSGIVTARAEYLYGCPRLFIESTKQDGTRTDGLWFDEPRLAAESPATQDSPEPVPLIHNPH